MTAGSADHAGFPSAVYVGLGSNLDNPVGQILRAFREIGEIAGTTVVRRSSLYETAPIGGGDQPAFINAVAEVKTTLSPRRLMQDLLTIEQHHNRIRIEKNGPRTLDLDILIFNDWRVDAEDIVTPHPCAHQRAFVLHPLLEIAPEAYLPGRGFARDFLPVVADQVIRKMHDVEA